ncbi:MAG: WecB/TagA/CpsF family glycosyltransferase [Gemmataceae bacterium]|nr:WecB/TagA/CpsF family glycosyltransferase [Gemmataceae bacterium]
MPDPVWALGLPLAPLDMAGTVAAVNALIARREPSFFVTANLNYAMLADRDPEVRVVNRRAAFVIADGMPLVWAGRLPERVAGSDLLFELAANAAARGHRVFLAGGAEGVAATAAERLAEKYPGLNVVGIEVPPFRRQSAAEEAAMIARIRAAEPDLLIGAFSQPHGEKWLAANVERLGVPACVQLGASLDFAAGRVRRSPRWVARLGLEWGFRFAVEPRRLGGRYFRNAAFLARRLLSRSRHPQAS